MTTIVTKIYEQSTKRGDCRLWNGPPRVRYKRSQHHPRRVLWAEANKGMRMPAGARLHAECGDDSCVSLAHASFSKGVLPVFEFTACLRRCGSQVLAVIADRPCSGCAPRRYW